MYLLYDSPGIAMAAMTLASPFPRHRPNAYDDRGRGGTVEGEKGGQHNAARNRPEATDLGD